MKATKRLKRLWQLSKKDKASLEQLTDKQIEELPDEDTKAVFISSGSEEEFKEFENEQNFGSKKIFDV